MLIINKSEVKNKNINDKDISKLGFKDIIHISAEHRLGYDDLYQIIDNSLARYNKLSQYSDNEEGKSINIAIIGKPNVGLSLIHI